MSKKKNKGCGICKEPCLKPWCVVKTEEAEEAEKKEKDNDGDTDRNS